MSSPSGDSSLSLSGITVVVTRAKAQASALSEKLHALGAKTVGVATIEIVAPSDGGAALTAAMANMVDYDQMAVASPNGAQALATAVIGAGLDPADLAPVACVGPSTADKLAGSPLKVNMVPDRAVAEGLVEALPAPPKGTRLLLIQAEVSRPTLEDGLRANGWEVDRVTAYRTIDAEVTNQDRTRASAGDLITFTSSSTVERFVRLVGADSMPPVVASIGPITSATAKELGVVVDIEADPHTIDGLIAAIANWAKP